MDDPGDNYPGWDEIFRISAGNEGEGYSCQYEKKDEYDQRVLEKRTVIFLQKEKAVFPKVVIIMAMYKPNIKWLKELLRSLNNQDYPCLELLVWNDCPDDDNHEDVFKKYITKFPYKIIKGSINLGSNRAFEKLTELASGDYLAYCDQDDIWHPNKISTLIALMEKEKSTLACSDMRVIDGDGNIKAEHITDVRPRQTFVSHEKQIETLLVRNFVTGCTMIVRSDIAKKALPFPDYRLMVHDHWMAFWNAVYGKISICMQPLIDYRIHGDNQTVVLAGIYTKEDYYTRRCFPYYERLKFLGTINFPVEVKRMVQRKIIWSQKRYLYAKDTNITNAIKLFYEMRNNTLTTGFEILLPVFPEWVFKRILNALKE